MANLMRQGGQFPSKLPTVTPSLSPQPHTEWQDLTRPLQLHYSTAVIEALAVLSLSTLRTQDEDQIGDAIIEALKNGGLSYRRHMRDTEALVEAIMANRTRNELGPRVRVHDVGQVHANRSSVADNMMVEALLIYYGLNPFITSVQVPRYEKLPPSVLRNCPQYNLILLEGEFIFLKQIEETYVYVFSFTKPEPCSTIGHLHGMLPPTTECDVITTQMLCEVKSHSGAGSTFLYGNPEVATADYASPKLVVNFNLDAMCNLDRHEDDRRDDLLAHLRMYFAKNYEDVDIKLINPRSHSRRRDNNFCMFSGSGDLLISRKDDTFILMTHSYTEINDGSLTEEYEERSSLNIETKDLFTMSMADIISQLKSNMLW